MSAHCANTTVKLSQDARLIARDMWYPICLKMQNMIAKDPRTVPLAHCVSNLFILHMISCLNIRDTNDNV